jgi:RND family efflux transporter MFP subunit
MGPIATRLRVGVALAAVLAAVLALAGCGERNRYQPPPPAEVTVAKPEQRKVTLYLEVTGSTAPFNRVDLVARVPGFLERVGYKDGAIVKKGDVLFQIDKKDYEISLQIAEATQKQQEALLLQANADLERKRSLVKSSAVSVAQLDESRAKRDSTQAALDQAKGQVEQARRNLEYTTILAPFDGMMSARLVDAGAFVGSGSPTTLATIVQVNPLYVNFNVDEQQVLTIREKLRNHGMTLQDVGPVPIDVGLQTEQGYPHSGTLDYVAPEITSSTGTLAARAVFDNKDHVLVPGLFVRVRIPKQVDVESLLVPDIALGNNQEGRYLLIVNDKNVVEQRQVEAGEQVNGGLRIITNGLKPGERVVVGGLMRALPGNTVVPVTASAAAGEKPGP